VRIGIGGGKERPVNPAEQEGMLAMETGDEVPSDGTIVGKAKKRGGEYIAVICVLYTS